MYKISDNVYYVGVADPNLEVFDIFVETKYGTTYNSYIVRGEKTALIDSAHEKFCDEYISEIEQVLPISEIDYIICNHTEPDHAGSLAKILEINPDITVIGSIAALKNLKEITNKTFKEQLAKDGAELDLGGAVLSFHIAPNLHWPDTMVTYYAEKKILFSCDVFGCHYCRKDFNKNEYDDALKVYFDCIVRPFNQFVQKGLEKLSALEIETVCPSHGPVLTSLIGEVWHKYDEWSKPIVNEPKKISVIYASAYGYTKALAQAAASALKDAGYDAQVFDAAEDKSAAIKALNLSDGVMVGIPTLNRNMPEPIWELIGGIDIISAKNRQFALFGSYGWSGEACALASNILKAMKLKVYGEPLKVVFKPDEENLKEIAEFALGFAASL